MRPNLRLLWGVLASLAVSGCGGGGGGLGSPVGAPISVSLSSATVVVSPDGKPTDIQITIRSTSETALVSFVGLPGGVAVKYSASDTNPSGLLEFKAIPTVIAGTYMPILSVNSAGQMAMHQFTLIVPAK